MINQDEDMKMSFRYIFALNCCPQECRGELMSFMSGICKLGRCFSCLKIFLILESNLTFQRSCLFSLIVEMKSERCQFLKVFLEIKLYWSKIQHTLFNVVLWLSCTFEREKKNWLVVRLKWLFPWFFISILNSNFGYIFWLSVMRWPFMNFKKNKVPESKLEALSRKIVSFS